MSIPGWTPTGTGEVMEVGPLFIRVSRLQAMTTGWYWSVRVHMLGRLAEGSCVSPEEARIAARTAALLILQHWLATLEASR